MSPFFAWNSWYLSCCLQPTSSADESKSSSSYALAFRWFVSLIINLNADTFSSSLNAWRESHPMKACSLDRTSQILSPNDLPCLLMSMCLVGTCLPHLIYMFPCSLKSHQCHQLLYMQNNRVSISSCDVDTIQEWMIFILWQSWKKLPGLFDTLSLSSIKQELHPRITK